MIHWTDTNLWIAVACIVFNPLYWNVVARFEYRTRALTRAFGSPHRGCVLLAITILLLGFYRDWRYKLAMGSQPMAVGLQQNWILWSGHFMVITGITLVITSFLALGFYGTFLGDYFGILMKEKVTGFPFNVTDNPMYWGSALNFLGVSLVQASQTGMFLSLLVIIMYRLAIAFEQPFTENIYKQRDEKEKQKREIEKKRIKEEEEEEKVKEKETEKETEKEKVS